MIIDQLVLYFNILRTNMAALEYSRVSGLVVLLVIGGPGWRLGKFSY